MSHFFTKKGLRGFTLIELLVVIAIIGLLSTVIAAPITEARKKGRDSKKISDLRSIVTAASIYADDHGGAYPPSIEALVPRYLANLPSNAATSTIARDKYMYVAYTDPGLGASGTVISYHLGVKLEAGNQALADDYDCDSSGDGASATGGSSKFCVGTKDAVNAANKSCTTACTLTFPNRGTQTGGAIVEGVEEFIGGTDDATTQCTSSLDSCVYDLIGN